MKQTRTLLMLLFAILVGREAGASAPPAKDWQRCFGGSQLDVPGNMIRTSDGKIVMLSNIDSNNGDVLSNHGSTDMWLTKLDSAGNMLWQKSFGGTSIDVGTGLIELPGGNLVISGYTSSVNGDITTNHGNFDVVMICTDKNGNKLWTKIYGGSLPDLSYASRLAKDGGILLGGGSYSHNGNLNCNNGDQDFWIIKTDSAGNIQWQRACGGSGLDVCYALDEDGSGNIYACGTTNSTSGNFTAQHGNFDFCVVKLDRNGTILWQKTYGGSDYETAQTVLIDKRGNILIGGYTLSTNGDVAANYGSADSWLIAIDAAGHLLMQKNYGGSNGDYLFDINETNDGGYLFTSGSLSDDLEINNHFGGEDIWQLKTDSMFNVQWSRNYGGTGNDRPVKTLINQDDGILSLSYTFSNDGDVQGQHGGADIWLLNLSCSVPVASFSITPVVCLHDTVSLTDLSSGGAIRSWFLNNSSLSSEASVLVPFNSAGFQRITLIVQSCVLSSTYSMDVNVYDCNLPLVNFTAGPNAICPGGQIAFFDSSINASSRIWTFPGGTPATSTDPRPVVTYSQPGSYSVLLKAINSYGDQSVLRYNMITVYPNPAKPAVTQQGPSLSATPALHYQWYFNSQPVSNAQSQALTASANGYYQVKVIDQHGCSEISDSIYYTVTGIEPPVRENVPVTVNPGEGEFTLNFNASGKTAIYMFNAIGQLVKLFPSAPGTGPVTFRIDDIPTGLYRLVFTDENQKTIIKSILKS